MSENDFWIRAWRTAAALDNSQPGGPGTEEIIAALRDDLILQQFVFVHRRWSVPGWLSAFRSGGLYASPPPVERTEKGVRARGWPAMEYLKASADTDRDEVAAILLELRSENWWVVADGLDAAARLPAPDAVAPILHLISEWQRVPVAWVDPRVMVSAILRVAEGGGSAELALAVMRVVDKLSDEGAQRYELDEVLRHLRDAPEELHPAVADGLEMAIAARMITSRRTWAPALDDLDPEMSDATELVASAWVTFTAGDLPSSRRVAIGRAIRLGAAADPLLRQMGFRSLRIALRFDPTDHLALATLDRVASLDDLFSSRADQAELAALFGEHFGLLPVATRANLSSRLLALAGDEDRLTRYIARDWLHAIREHTGAVEELALMTLLDELGPPRPSGFRSGMASFIAPRGAVTTDDVVAMSPSELIALMRTVPRVGGMFGDTSVESTAGIAKAELERRPTEFLPYLGQIAEEVGYPPILHHVLWGLEEAYKPEELRTDEARVLLLNFARDVVRKANAGSVDDAEGSGYSAASVLRAAASLFDTLAPWLLEMHDPAVFFEALDGLLASADPTPEHERTYGGSNMDPPTLALNTARGTATRALLHYFAAAASPEAGPSASHRSALEDRIRGRATAEVSPSVRSGFGIFLPQIIVFSPSLWADIAPVVLPTDSDAAGWESVFTTYVMFNHAHWAVAETLRPMYILAADRMRDERFQFLRKHAGRVINHLAALALPQEAGKSAEWQRLLERALDAAPGTEASHALRALGRAISREQLEVDAGWILTTVRTRLRSLGPDAGRSDEATGLLQLLLDSRIPPVDAGGEILDLLYSGASVTSWSLVEYLIHADVPRSVIGAQVLMTAIDRGQGDPYIRDVPDYKRLLTEYGEKVPEVAWPLLNKLGENGQLDLESVAQIVAAALGEWTA